MESRLLGFPCFPYSVISMACFGNVHSKIEVTYNPVYREVEYQLAEPTIRVIAAEAANEGHGPLRKPCL